LGTGSLIVGEQQLSKSIYNHKFILVETAAVIEALTTTQKFDGMTCSPTTNGAQLLRGHLYVWDATNTTWLDQANPAHTHSSTVTGGTLQDIFTANDPVLYLGRETDMIYQVTSGSGASFANTVSGTDAYRSAITGTSSNAAATYMMGGLRYDFAFPLSAHFRALFSTVTTSYTSRIGFNMEYAHISSNASKKLGVEACDSCNGVNLRIVSSDGTTRSATNTTDVASTAATYKLTFNPSVPNLTYRKNSGTAVIKSSNMFTTGVPDRSNVFIAGIQTTNTTSKTLQLWGARIIGTMSADSGEWV
jgi:hypothetical protein